MVFGVPTTNGKHSRRKPFVKLFFGFRMVFDATFNKARIVQNGLPLIVNRRKISKKVGGVKKNIGFGVDLQIIT